MLITSKVTIKIWQNQLIISKLIQKIKDYRKKFTIFLTEITPKN